MKLSVIKKESSDEIELFCLLYSTITVKISKKSIIIIIKLIELKLINKKFTYFKLIPKKCSWTHTNLQKSKIHLYKLNRYDF